jgi:hypothetical protein
MQLQHFGAFEEEKSLSLVMFVCRSAGSTVRLHVTTQESLNG